MQQIAQGAEAIIYLNEDKIIKDRFSKNYRLPQLDEQLRKFRTRREAKILTKLEELNFPAPKLKDFCDKRMSITMDFLPGEKLKDVLGPEKNDFKALAREFGTKVGKLHQNNIIHGDLTTSNVLLHQENKELHFIDFGLSAFSEKVEDKAVDLFLLDRALESKHYQLYPQVFEAVVEGYKETYPEAEKVLARFAEVKKRGRNKNK
jgi:Kae1-associated kinase Bud32